MLSPKQVSESLTVPPSTIRRWSARFAGRLSTGKLAPGQKRTYTLDDLETLRRIRNLLADGVTLDRIDSLLDVVEQPPDESAALVSLADVTQSLTTAYQMVDELRQIIDDQSARITTLEEWINTPWYKRIGKKPDISGHSETNQK